MLFRRGNNHGYQKDITGYDPTEWTTRKTMCSVCLFLLLCCLPAALLTAFDVPSEFRKEILQRVVEVANLGSGLLPFNPHAAHRPFNGAFLPSGVRQILRRGFAWSERRIASSTDNRQKRLEKKTSSNVTSSPCVEG